MAPTLCLRTKCRRNTFRPKSTMMKYYFINCFLIEELINNLFSLQKLYGHPPNYYL